MPIETRYPVSQGYGHKRALEKGGAVKGSGRAILFNKVTSTQSFISLFAFPFYSKLVPTIPPGSSPDSHQT